MTEAINKFAAVAAAAAQTSDYTKAQKGGGDFKPMEAGPCRLRLIGYVEVGKHEGSYQGKPKTENVAWFIFEVSGPKHPAREHEGVKYPNILSVKVNKSLNEKARFFKLFALLNHAGKAKVPAELLGQAYKGVIVHRKYKKRDGSDGVAVELWDKATASWKIEPPVYEIVGEDGPTGEFATLKVDAPMSPLSCFMWDYADMEQWNSIFIEGEYAEVKDDSGKVIKPARSKNVYQDAIKSAINFKDSPIYTLLLNNGQSVDLPINPADMGDEEEGSTGEAGAPWDAGQAGGPANAPDPLAGVSA